MSKHRAHSNGGRTEFFLAFQTCFGHSQDLDRIRNDMPDDRAWKKIAPVDDHISVAFLGALGKKGRRDLTDLVDEFCRAADPVKLSFRNLYLFENAPRVIESSFCPEGTKGSLAAFLDPVNAAQLQAFRRELIIQILKPNKFEYGYGPFMPHNTLARIKRLSEQEGNIADFIKKHGEMKTPEYIYTHLTLFQRNENSNDDSKYEVVATFPFRNLTPYRRNSHEEMAQLSRQ
ncbi:MAG: 2'-5' RNA ligase family protein [Alphaproteobacteria bacterium]